MKPYVICHMVTTIDGRILGDRWGKTGSRDIFETTAATFGVTAWLCGTTTMKEFAGRPVKLKKSKLHISRDDHIVTRDASGYAIGVDPNGTLPWKTGTIDSEHVIALLSDQASDDYLAHLQSKGVSYLLCGEKDVDLAIALDKLARQFKLKKLMLEGGGKINGSFLKEGLIDEISHVTVPIADGGMGVSTFFDIVGPAPSKAAARLRLKSHRKLPGGVHWSRYGVIGKVQ